MDLEAFPIKMPAVTMATWSLRFLDSLVNRNILGTVCIITAGTFGSVVVFHIAVTAILPPITFIVVVVVPMPIAVVAVPSSVIVITVVSSVAGAGTVVKAFCHSDLYIRKQDRRRYENAKVRMKP